MALVKRLVQKLNGQASLGLSITGVTRGQSMHVSYKPKSEQYIPIEAESLLVGYRQKK
jgi:hypothetical protein